LGQLSVSACISAILSAKFLKLHHSERLGLLASVRAGKIRLSKNLASADTTLEQGAGSSVKN
jgi:hypothetical protein